MELIFLLFGLFLFVTVFQPWINMFRIGSLNEEVRALRNDVQSLRTQLLLLKSSPHASDEAETEDHNAPAESYIAANYDNPPEQYEHVVQNAPNQTEWNAATPFNEEEQHHFIPETTEDFEHFSTASSYKRSKANFEMNIGSKLPVWIGAISLAFAAFFLIKYSIESGWLGPIVRLTLGGLFGGSLLIVGYKITNHPTIPNAPRIAQGLIGAGLVSLYACLYGAVHLYHLLPPMVGFAGMVIVTGLAIILSLRHGQAIAIFGLVGGFLTPALIGSTEPQAVALFSYLFLLFSGMLFVMARQGWWVLAILALCAVYGWTGLWYATAFIATDSTIIGLFTLAICAVVLAATMSHTRKAHHQEAWAKITPLNLLNILAIAGGAVTLLWLSVETRFSLFDWSALGLIGLACVILSYFNPRTYGGLLFIKAIADVILLLIWSAESSTTDILSVIGGLSAIYIALPHILMHRTSNPLVWPRVQSGIALSLYLIAWIRMDDSIAHEHPYAWGLIALIIAAYFIFQTRDIKLNYTRDERDQTRMVAEYAMAATAFISIGMAIELPQNYLPAAFAAQIAATLWIQGLTGIRELRKICTLLIFGVLFLSYKPIAMFSTLIINSVFDDRIPRSVFNQMQDLVTTGSAFIELGIPAIFMALALAIHRRELQPAPVIIHGLFAISLWMTSGLIYLFMHFFMSETSRGFAQPLGFIDRGFITLTFATIGISGLYYARWTNLDFIKPWAVAFFHIAMARIVWFDLITLNPFYERSQMVGGIPILNGVTMTYGCGVILSLWFVKDAIRNGLKSIWVHIYGTLGFVLLFTLSSLTVRQIFHGKNLAVGMTSNAEMYGYSIAWLVTGLAILAYGIIRNSKIARLASMLFITLTIGKVFLLDAAELEGLYRVFSFMGLGFSLIGLSVFYTRFIARYGKP